jgi:hypothetical protein
MRAGGCANLRSASGILSPVSGSLRGYVRLDRRAKLTTGAGFAYQINLFGPELGFGWFLRNDCSRQVGARRKGSWYRLSTTLVEEGPLPQSKAIAIRLVISANDHLL